MTRQLLSAFLLWAAACTVHAQVVINEYSAANLNTITDNFTDHNDWIEIYNGGSAIVDMSGYYLSDNPSEPRKWRLPQGYLIPAKGWRVIWASGRDTALKSVSTWHVHTNFKITQSKKNAETLVLSDASGVKLDEIKVGKTRVGQSRGRQTDGAATWVIFQKPTPRLKNAGAYFTSNAEKPAFSLKAGFYTTPQTIRISTTQTNAAIHYTLDGTMPTPQSPRYTTPLVISKTAALQAVSVSSDPTVQSSLIEFATFFIREPRNGLRVMSVTGDSLLTLAEGSRETVGFGSFEYFNADGERTASAYGEFNGHGQDSWVNDQRSIDLVCRDECGYDNVLEDKIFDLSERNEFQRIILRASGDDNYPDGSETPGGGAHMRDAFLQNLVKKGGMHLDVRTAEKAIVFLNGQYWGLYDLRERPDDHDYTEHYYGQDKYHLQYIKTWDRTWAEYGGNKALSSWETLRKYITDHDMSNQQYFDVVNAQLDVASLADYVIVNSVSVCSDWLNYNVGWWRGMNPAGQRRKWGYNLWDNDATFGYYYNYTGIPDTSAAARPCDVEVLKDSVAFNVPPYIAEDTLTLNGVIYLPGDTVDRGGVFKIFSDLNGHIDILTRLMKNKKFRQYYVTRYANLLNTVFKKENMLSELDAIYEKIQPEMPRHIARWGGTMQEWEGNVARLRDYIDRRTSLLRDSMSTCYQLTGPYSVTFQVDPPGSGSMQINARHITQFPFADFYYGGIENTLSVQMNPAAYRLQAWEIAAQSSIQNASATETSLFVAGSDTVTARLRKVPVAIRDLAGEVQLRLFPTIVNDALTLEYHLAAPENVQITLLSMQGIPLAQLLNSAQPAGSYALTARLAAAALPAGCYWIEFRTPSGRTTQKIWLQ